MEKRFDYQEALREKEKIVHLTGPNASSELYTKASNYLDDIKAAKKAGWKPGKRPTEEELENFSIKPEIWEEGLTYCDNHVEDLLDAAALAEANAVSYRTPPFQVGCAVMGVGPQLEKGDYSIHTSYNFKPAPKVVSGKDKLCAERNALDGARRDCKVILGIATSSKETATGDRRRPMTSFIPAKIAGIIIENCLMKDLSAKKLEFS